MSSVKTVSRLVQDRYFVLWEFHVSVVLKLISKFLLLHVQTCSNIFMCRVLYTEREIVTLLLSHNYVDSFS